MEGLFTETENNVGEVVETAEFSAKQEEGLTSDAQEKSEDIPVKNEEVETPSKDESPRETAKREFEKLQKQDNPAEEKIQPEKKAKQEQDPELLPPARLKPQEAKLFNNLPAGLKRAFNRTIKEVEGGGSRAIEQAAREKQEITALATPLINEHFPTEKHVFESLIRAQEKLTNPQTSRAEYIKLGVNLGHIEEEAAAEALQGLQQTGNFDITQHPEFRALQERLNSVTSTIEQSHIDREAEPIVNQMRSVQQEVDPATGNYRYPELQDGDYLLSLKTRVSSLRDSDPSLSWGDALRQATEEKRQALWGGSFPQGQVQTRPLTANNNQIQQRAAQAAVTVRGKSSPASVGALNFNPPPEALRSNDPRATAIWAYEQLKNRG